jgi:hypothetical protein
LSMTFFPRGAVVSANVPQIPASVIIGCSGGDTQKNYRNLAEKTHIAPRSLINREPSPFQPYFMNCFNCASSAVPV